jgi:hypothetical protein
MSNYLFPTRVIEKSYSDADKLPAGDTLLSLASEGGREIYGVVRCDQAVTLQVQWGFGGLYDVFETTINVPANFAEGGGIKIGPFHVLGPDLQVKVNNPGAATGNFRVCIYQLP